MRNKMSYSDCLELKREKAIENRESLFQNAYEIEALRHFNKLKSNTLDRIFKADCFKAHQIKVKFNDFISAKLKIMKKAKLNKKYLRQIKTLCFDVDTENCVIRSNTTQHPHLTY